VDEQRRTKQRWRVHVAWPRRAPADGDARAVRGRCAARSCDTRTAEVIDRGIDPAPPIGS